MIPRWHVFLTIHGNVLMLHNLDSFFCARLQMFLHNTIPVSNCALQNTVQ